MKSVVKKNFEIWQARVQRCSLGIVFLPFFTLFCCVKSDYTLLVERELSKGIRNDSLFLGLHFGMTRQQFYDQCMNLNRQHLTTVGFKNYNVLYKLSDSAGSIAMHFYPHFDNERIYKMPTIFSYENWTPFDKNTHPDSLQVRIKKMLEQWYGTGFIWVDNDEYGRSVFVKVDGNRQIVLFCEGEMDVKAVFTDLSVENKLITK